MKPIRAWLETLGLGRYADAFEVNAIEPDHLRDLDHEILKELGVVAIGHRLTILKAAASVDEAVPVHEVEPAAGATPDADPSGEAERRQLTVMFFDLVGSVEMGERMDVEAYRDLLTRFRGVAVEAVDRFDGFVARHQGDGLLAYFGYPQAREDDAERAVRAGLDVLDRVDALRDPTGEALRVRIGIATGPAIVGDLLATGATHEVAALGSTPNLAARLQGQAEPSTMLVSSVTARLLGERFELEPVSLELKGFDTKLAAFSVIAPLVRQSMVDAVEADTLTPLVGREADLSLLLGRWRRALDGEGQVIALSGEPGVGKSRLAREFAATIEADAKRVLTFHGSPYHQESPLHPIVARLEQALTAPPNAPADGRSHALEAWLREQGLEPDQMTASFEALLSPGSHVTDDPQRLKRQINEALLAWLVQEEGQPALIVTEDAHWMDPSTLDLLGELIERIVERSVCILVTHRPEFEIPWNRPTHQTTYALGGLSRREVDALVRGSSAGFSLAPAAIQSIVARADGLPLFAEELTRALLESATGDAAAIGAVENRVPFTLKDSLTARLDRLGAAKRLAQAASVLGRHFTSRLLVDLGEFGDAETEAHLAALTRSGLVLADRSRGADAYLFKHALVRDAAYESMLHSRRREIHARAASALEANDPDLHQKQPEVLAHHLEQAGDADRAFDLWCAAGRRSAEASHYAEAIGAYYHALGALDTRAPSPARDRSELHVRISLVAPLVAAHGFGAAAIADNANRALELCDVLDDDVYRFVAWYAKWVNFRVRGKVRELLDVVRAIQAHPAASEPKHRALVLRMEGQSLFDLDRPQKAIDCLNECVTVLLSIGERSFVYGTEPLVQARFYLSLCHWLIGDPASARRFGHEALTDAEALGHTNTLAVCLGHIGFILNALSRDRTSMHASMQGLAAMADEKALPQWQGVSRFGLAMCVDAPRESAAAMQGALDLLERIDVRAWRPLMLSWQAERQASFDAALALRTLDTAITQIEQDGEGWACAEVLRGKARVLHAIGQPDDARECLDAALAVARDAGYRAWELRCLTTRVEHGDQRDADDALAELSRCVESFDDDLDLPDLVDARRLIAAM
jgi:class 3 adenylate cyclase/tetratricopeptide (TPR) repeat protein